MFLNTNTTHMKLKSLLYITLFSATISNVVAQDGKTKVADKLYDNYSYVEAIKTYERIAAKGYKSVDMFGKLGNSYYFNADLVNANKWYKELFAMNETSVEPEYYYRYSQTLKATGDYKKADEMLVQFNNLSGNDQRAKMYLKSKNYLEVIKTNSNRYVVADAGVNSEFYDYGTSFVNDKLVFSSTRKNTDTNKKSQWNTQNFATMYSADVLADGSLGAPVKFSNNLTTKLNEDTPVFTKDGKTIYFTRNNYNDGKQGKDSKKTTLLKIYRANYDGKEWTNVQELPFNSDQYSVAHPALSPDDKTLYFASDMPGTLGQADIYKVAINNGTFGTPINLGNTINTQGRETFPFVSGDNELYFATDGHPGLGGLDIFVSKIKKDGSLDDAQNVGEPVNGKTDDFGFIIDVKSKIGYFTSNREGGKGFDDIYKFTETRSLVCTQQLVGVITNETSGLIMPGTKVILLNSKFEQIATTMSDERANYSFEVTCGESYYVRGEKEEYETNEQKIAIPRTSGKTNLPIAFAKKIIEVKVGDDLAKTLDIPIIYFDLDKSFIRKDAALELEKVLDVMKQNPKMVVDIRSHTDSRATAEYNESLSDRRAKSTMTWLVKNGIKQSRLTAKGYGESQLVNKCADGVVCTEAEHQANRRSEFIVVSIK
jgi:outer membrane protein OmpA-like peptidoglycan-associated protein